MPNPQNLVPPVKTKKEGPGMATIGDGVIGSTRVTNPKPQPEVTIQSNSPDTEKVAVYSSKKIFWEGVGRLNRGYNIMTQSKANKWLTMDGVRLATPEEVAKEYNI